MARAGTDWRGLLGHNVHVVCKPCRHRRSLSDTFAGIPLTNVSAFIGAQLAGAIVGLLVTRALRTLRPSDSQLAPERGPPNVPITIPQIAAAVRRLG